MVLLSAAERLQGRAGRALKGCQEASTSFHCSRLHLSSLRNTSEILVSLKPPGIFDSCSPSNPARGTASFALCRGGGEVCGHRVRCSFPYLDKEVTRGLGPGLGRQLAALSQPFPLCPSATPVLPRAPLSCSHPEAMMSTGKMCSFK